MLIRYCNVDYEKEIAIVAEVREKERRKLIGIGRLIIDRELSDIDVLVEFEKDVKVGLLKMAHIENELSVLLGARVDLRTPADLSRYFRQEVIEGTEVQYARDDVTRVRHMLDAAKEAVSFIRARKRADLDKDRMLTLSIVKSVEIIGEAASKVTIESREAWPEIPLGGYHSHEEQTDTRLFRHRSGPGLGHGSV
jgi:hypothetical protein